MDYRVSELAKLSGVSARTLRYYDQIGLLRPERTDSNGYRVYGRAQVDRLQQILFYRALGFPLGQIREILSAPGFDLERSLESHLAALQIKREQIDALIHTVRRTIRSVKEGTAMSDSKKFEGFKQAMIDENEEKYGAELRERFGDDAVDASRAKVKGMSQKQWEAAQALEEKISAALKEAFAQGDPAGKRAQEACDLHRQWLCLYWKDGTYSKAAHRALAQAYAADERFSAYYDRIAPGCAKFFRDAIEIYCGR